MSRLDVEEHRVSYQPADLVNAMLAGQRLNVLRAIRIVPSGQQAGLTPVRLRGTIEIDPRTDDFFTSVDTQNRPLMDT